MIQISSIECGKTVHGAKGGSSTSEVQKGREAQRSTEKYEEMSKSMKNYRKVHGSTMTNQQVWESIHFPLIFTIKQNKSVLLFGILSVGTLLFFCSRRNFFFCHLL